MKLPNYAKYESDKVIYTGNGTFQFYVPEKFFNKKIAVVKGEYIDVFGLLNYTIVDKNGKNNGLKRFQIETMITTKPSTVEKLKNIKLTTNTPAQDYRVFKYENGDEIISTCKVPEIIENAELFFKMFLYGDIPTTVPYNIGHTLFKKNINISGNDYGLNMQLFGMLFSEACRSIHDRKVLFRHTKMDDMTAYQILPIKDMPKYVSAQTSITSENWDEAVIHAIINKKVSNSPLERLITG